MHCTALTAMGLRLIATVLFVGVGATVKAIGSDVPIGEVVFFRSAVAWLVLACTSLVRGTARLDFSVDQMPAHALRAVIGCSAMTLNFISLSVLPLVNAEALAFLTPLILITLAPLFGERVTWPRALAGTGGFVGICLIIGPDLSTSTADTNWTGAICGGAGATLAAISLLLARQLTFRATSHAIALHFSGMSAVLTAASASGGWVMPGTTEAVLLVFCGLLGAAGHLVNAAALRRAEASLLASLDYTGLLWAMAAGYILFSEVPGPMEIVGVGIIIAVGALVVVLTLRR
jgi:drug/metabolite transporter (DMT)-like permease